MWECGSKASHACLPSGALPLADSICSAHGIPLYLLFIFNTTDSWTLLSTDAIRSSFRAPELKCLLFANVRVKKDNTRAQKERKVFETCLGILVVNWCTCTTFHFSPTVSFCTAALFGKDSPAMTIWSYIYYLILSFIHYRFLDWVRVCVLSVFSVQTHMLG